MDDSWPTVVDFESLENFVETITSSVTEHEQKLDSETGMIEKRKRKKESFGIPESTIVTGSFENTENDNVTVKDFDNSGDDKIVEIYESVTAIKSIQNPERDAAVTQHKTVENSGVNILIEGLENTEIESVNETVEDPETIATERENIQNSSESISENFKNTRATTITESVVNSGSSTSVAEIIGNSEIDSVTESIKNFGTTTTAEHENLQERRLKIQQIRHEVSNAIIKKNNSDTIGSCFKDDQEENIGDITLSDLKLVLFDYFHTL